MIWGIRQPEKIDRGKADMILILCVDDAMGTSFDGKRQSRDRVVTKDILKIASDSVLWTDEYSARLFFGDGEAGAWEGLSGSSGFFSSDTVSPENVKVDEACLEKAGPGEYCFVELQDASACRDLEMIFLYRWNRLYPSTAKFTMPEGFIRIAEEEFPGYSHEKITRDVYVR